MGDAAPAAARQAAATCGTALVVGTMHLRDPFLGVLAAYLTAGLPAAGHADAFKRLAGALGGAFAGTLLLTAVPDQPWLSLPLFSIAAWVGPGAVFSWLGPAPAIFFAMGLCGVFSEGIIHPGEGLRVGMTHALSLSTAAIVSALARAAFPTTGAPPSARSSFPQGGLASVIALVATCAVLPALGVVASIAALTTLISWPPQPGTAGGKLAGGALGVALSLAFLTVVSGAGNDVAIFLVGFGLVFAALEWLAVRNPTAATALRQAGAMFAVAATIMPGPSGSLAGPIARMAAVTIGLFAALGIHLTAARLP